MAIRVDERKMCFSLDTNNTSYQMKVNSIGVLMHLYYGGKLAEGDCTDYLLAYYDRGFSGNPYEVENDRTVSLDLLPQEYPSFGVGDFRTPVLNLVQADGSYAVDFRYESYEVKKGKYGVDGMPAVYGAEEEAETLEITLCDKPSGIRLVLYYGVFEELDVITRAAKLVNESDGEIVLNRALSACLDIMDGDWELVHFHGRHCMERQMERVPIMHGVQSVGSARGMSSHQHNPFIILCDKNATEDYGDCYGMSLVYSGNFCAEAEKDQMDQVRIVMGIGDRQFQFHVGSGQSFFMPEVVMSYSSAGFGPLSYNYHRIYRRHLCRGKYKTMRRPVLINNWEATYFDFNEKKLLDIAKEASGLGIEMLVMDDGWFGERNGDLAGLGDWTINEKKLKGGLKPLVDQINALGMKFGIWFEPEMVNEDSKLYREHPDWSIQIPNRRPNRARFQLLLDLSRADVREYLFNSICSILDSANIEYVKWDFNRSICDAYSQLVEKERQGEVYHRYMLGLYELLERIVQKYPDLLLEGCSGGGGRFDPGMLYYSPQIWCSDDTDAIERLKIQYGTSFAYPVSTVGSHVSAVPNHQTGRTVSYETRGIVAMQGGFGYELDLTKLTEEEKELTRKQVEAYKKYYDLITAGTYYRLTDPFQNENFTAWEYAAEDKAEALVSVVYTKALANSLVWNIKVKGLDPGEWYQIEGENGCYSGAALMNGGLRLPASGVVGTFQKKEGDDRSYRSCMPGDYRALQYHIIKKQL